MSPHRKEAVRVAALCEVARPKICRAGGPSEGPEVRAAFALAQIKKVRAMHEQLLRGAKHNRMTPEAYAPIFWAHIHKQKVL